MTLIEKRDELKQKAQSAWDELMKIHDTNSAAYAKALEKYDRIVDEEIDVLEKLGFPDANPCPLQHKDLPCSECSGWYLRKDERGAKQAKEGEGEKCVLKDIKGEGEDLAIMSKLIR